MNNVIEMELMFYNCSSLSSLPDISKWNTNNLINSHLMFAKCISLISMPDISKWNSQNLKEMKCIFSDCNLLLSFPDISKWNNYNENDLKGKPDYKRINDILNFFTDIITFDSPDLLNNFKFIEEIMMDKIQRFLK